MIAAAHHTNGYVELILFAVGVHLLFGSLLEPVYSLIASFAPPHAAAATAVDEPTSSTSDADAANKRDKSDSGFSKGFVTQHGYPFMTPIVQDTVPAQHLHSWLEDLSNRNVKEFIVDEIKFTEKYLCEHKIGTEVYSEQMSAIETLLNLREPPIHRGSIFFYTQRGSLYAVDSVDKNSGDGSGDPPELIVDAVMEGTRHHRQLRGYWASGDGKKVAYAYNQTSSSGSGSGGEGSGSAPLYLRVRDICTLEDSPAICIDGNRGALSLSWFAYSNYLQGFFYTTRGGIYFHLLNSDPLEDVLIRECLTGDDECPHYHCEVHTSCDNHYLVIELFSQQSAQRAHDLEDMEVSYGDPTTVDNNKVFFIDLELFVSRYKAHRIRMATSGEKATSLEKQNIAKSLICCRLIDCFKHRFEYVSNIEDDFFFRTNFDADNFRIVGISIPRISPQNTDVDVVIPLHVILDSSNLREWIPKASDGSILVQASIAQHTVLVLTYFKDNTHDILLYDLAQLSTRESDSSSIAGDYYMASSSGGGGGSSTGVRPVATLPHPPCGSITSVTCDFSSPHIFYRYSSFDDPGSIWHALVSRDSYNGSIEISFDCYSSCKEALEQMFAGSGDEGVEFEVLCEELKSTDTYTAPADRGPAMLIFGRKDVIDDSNQQHPCILYTYGGFGVSTTPSFSLPIYVFARNYKGLFCLLSARGGGERGSKWANEGRNKNKERPITDLVAAAEYLIHNEFTNKDKLALLAEGNGAMLAMSAINRCPWLFAACGLVSGIYDVLRYHSFVPRRDGGGGETDLVDSLDSWSSYSTLSSDAAHVNNSNNEILISKIWYNEFGCSDESPYERERLRQYSPLHGVVKDLIEVYPAMLMYCSEDDTSPPPQHTLKMVAELRSAAFDSHPKAVQLLLVDTEARRGRREELLRLRHATIFAFICTFIEAEYCK